VGHDEEQGDTPLCRGVGRRLPPRPRTNPELFVGRCGYMGVFRRDPRCLQLLRGRGVSKLTVGLWLAVLVAVMFFCTLWLAQRFAA
jgi:hypothetical protein